ncbi:5-formyltetrahydrofolate cyclo-ligase [Novosphingobium panipatense]|uniref:5-formyltetrahydrofolate cyclo-ligase n=1 Tax=Novosphingobium panipatense TaxID=428991 RepID=A0ABY1QL48_9SPHN|nr:5-formyltetrahydrofolate cyclo-ligase [Novosphingobium panipatense]SMP74648.1 5-formyltetrahydrofolate cyclo-ligase [Novosphingobium panipatense]
MVDPSPPIDPATGEARAGDAAAAKAALRQHFRQLRSEHVKALPQTLRALILNRPPAPIATMLPEGSTVGLYHPAGAEAPALGWARWLSENGRRIALPFFAARDAAMEFRTWSNPWDDEALEVGPWRTLQPSSPEERVIPDAVIVPLVAFTADCHRLGQGGGHYDRWLAANPDAIAIGLAWDCQLAEELPVEAHDQPLAAVVTPTRIYKAHD